MKNKKNTVFFALVLIGLLLSVFGCTSNSKNISNEKATQIGKKQVLFPVTVADDAGRKVTIEKEPKRIVSVAPSNTEVLCALGCRDMLVGVTSYCDYPEEVKTKEKVGTFAEPNLEKVLSLEPDIVFVDESKKTSFIKRLEEAKVNTFVISPKTVEDMIDVLERIGKVLGSKEKAANVSNELKNRLKKVEHTLSDVKEKKTAFYELYHEPLMTVGGKATINDMLEKSGVINIAGDIEDDYPQYSLETLIQKDPDVYLTSTGSMQSPGDLLKRPGWAKLTAVKNNQVFVFDESIINRPGPRMVDAVEQIAAAVYPELFTKD